MNVEAQISIHDDWQHLGAATLDHLDGPVVAVSGGSTFARLFPHWRGDDVRRCVFLPVDERCVGLSHPASNWKMAIEHLLDPNGLHEQAVHWSLQPAGLEDVLLNLAGAGPDGFPRIDQAWLGMGEDGHTASLFSGGPELDDLRSVVVATVAPVEPRPRVSLGLGTLRAARSLAVVATGAAKGPMLRRVLNGDGDLPLARVLADREARIFVDHELARAAGFV